MFLLWWYLPSWVRENTGMSQEISFICQDIATLTNIIGRGIKRSYPLIFIRESIELIRVDKGNFYLSNQELVSFGEHLV